MGAKKVLILVLVGFSFIAAISSAASETGGKGYNCSPLLANLDMLPSVQVYGQQSEVIIQNSRGEFLFVSRSDHSNNIGLSRLGAVPIEYLSFRIAKVADADRTQDLEPILLNVVLNNIYRSGVRPTYRPALQRKTYAFKLPGFNQPLIAVEHIQHLDSMTGSQKESITAKIISAFESR